MQSYKGLYIVRLLVLRSQSGHQCTPGDLGPIQHTVGFVETLNKPFWDWDNQCYLYPMPGNINDTNLYLG